MDMALFSAERSYCEEARSALARGEAGLAEMLARALATADAPILAGLLLEEAGAAGADLTVAARVAAAIWQGVDQPVTLALQGERNPWGIAATPFTAENGQGLNGAALAVPGSSAPCDIVFAYRDADGRPSAGRIAADHPALSSSDLICADRSRLHLVHMQALPLTDLAKPATAQPEQLLDLAALCAAALMTGFARQAMTLAVAHAKDRRLFGRTLGEFQVTRHLAADMLMDVEASTLLAREAFWATARYAGPGHLAAQAKLVANTRCVGICRTAQQMLGGAGFVHGNRVHDLYRRALTASLIFGTTPDHAHRLADAVTGGEVQPRMTAPMLSTLSTEEVLL
jgi:hypothetical protein